MGSLTEFMNWVEVTESDLKATMSAPEWEALAEIARADTASVPVTVAINRVVNKIRGYVESVPTNTLGPDGYVPAVLHDAALILILETLATSLPAAGIVLDDARNKRIETAKNELRMVAKNELKVSYGSGQSAGTDSPVADSGAYGGADPVDWAGSR